VPLTSEQMRVGCMVVREYPRRPGEAALAYVARIAAEAGFLTRAQASAQGIPRWPSGAAPVRMELSEDERERAQACLPVGDRE
jgi:hypothetical protein